MVALLPVTGGAQYSELTYIHTFIDHFPKGAFQCQLQRKG